MRYLLLLLTSATCVFGSVNIVPVAEVDPEVFPSIDDDVYMMFKGPVVVKGYAKEWPAMEWTPEYFRTHYGERTVRLYGDWNGINERWVKTGDGSEFLRNEDKGLIKEHFRRREADTEYKGYAIDRDSEALKEGMGLCLPETERENIKNLLMSSRKTVTRMHTHDAGSSFLLQLYGRKMVTLLAPEDCDNINCFSDYGFKYKHYVSELNPPECDVNRFRGLVNATVYQTIIEPGDLIYIPQFWFHHVIALEEENVSIANFVYIKDNE